MTNHPNRKRLYRVRLEWTDNHVSHTTPVSTKREAKQQVKSFAEVALMRRTFLEVAGTDGEWQIG